MSADQGPAPEALGCFFWGLAFFMPPIAFVLAMMLSKGHTGRVRGITVSSLFTVLGLVLFGSALVLRTYIAPPSPQWADAEDGYEEEDEYYEDDTDPQQDGSTVFVSGSMTCTPEDFIDYLTRRADLEVVKQFIECGVDVNARDSKGNTAVIAAFHRGGVSTMDVIIWAGADVNLPALNAEGEPYTTVLMEAIGQGWGAKAKSSSLLDRGADPNQTFEARNYKSPLQMSMQKDMEFVAEFLLEHGADIDHVDGRGMTALMYAARRGLDKIAEMLLEDYDADLTIVDNQGFTAFSHAQQKGHVALATLIGQYE